MKYAAFSRILIISIGLFIASIANSAPLFLGQYINVSGGVDGNRFILKATSPENENNENSPEQETPFTYLQSMQSLLQQGEGWEAVGNEENLNTVTIYFPETTAPTAENTHPSPFIGFRLTFTDTEDNPVNINAQDFIQALNPQEQEAPQIPETSPLIAFSNPDAIDYMNRIYHVQNNPQEQDGAREFQVPRRLPEEGVQVNDTLQITMVERGDGGYTLEYRNNRAAQPTTDLITVTITPVTHQRPLQVKVPDQTVTIDPSSDPENSCKDKVKRFLQWLNPYSWYQWGTRGKSGSDKQHHEALESLKEEIDFPETNGGCLKEMMALFLVISQLPSNPSTSSQ